MTRINVGFPPSKLTDRHLIAEHREIKRIPNNVATGKAIIKDIPSKFTLGTGHVKFFYNKLGYLRDRYQQVYDECVKRGFRVQYYGNAWDNVPPELMGNWTPTEADSELIRQRIYEKLNQI